MSKRTLGVVFFPAFDWAISRRIRNVKSACCIRRISSARRGCSTFRALPSTNPAWPRMRISSGYTSACRTSGACAPHRTSPRREAPIRAVSSCFPGNASGPSPWCGPRDTRHARHPRQPRLLQRKHGSRDDRKPAPPLRAAACGHRRYRLPSWRRYARHLLERS